MRFLKYIINNTFMHAKIKATYIYTLFIDNLDQKAGDILYSS
jgi:hypothetical protein